jgi:hypothetical protein
LFRILPAGLLVAAKLPLVVRGLLAHRARQRSLRGDDGLGLLLGDDPLVEEKPIRRDDVHQRLRHAALHAALLERRRGVQGRRPGRVSALRFRLLARQHVLLVLLALGEVGLELPAQIRPFLAHASEQSVHRVPGPHADLHRRRLRREALHRHLELIVAGVRLTAAQR